MTIERADETDLQVEKLLDKLRGWLLQQPEWYQLMLLSRQQRREAARLVAQELMKMPVRGSVDIPDRKARRRIARLLREEVM